MSNKNMKIVTWNINGIRTFKNGIKKALDSFDADIICVQETKVTRDLLDERTAIVDGYNSYFSFSRGRSGYSGVATFCKDSAAPCAAEEGLTDLLTNHGEAVGCYGDQKEFSTEELQLLDNEGRTVITQHKVMSVNGPETLTVLNVYCPRADPEKPERKLFKLQFYKLLQSRADAILAAGSHVIILGDVNTSHRPIDHCDPDDIDNFEENPGRKWLNSFLYGGAEADGSEFEEEDNRDEDSDTFQKPVGGGKFIDTFRHFHPNRANAFTCWSTLTGARQTNYGTRIDYIFANRSLAETCFLAADIMPEVEGSDHCPVWGHLSCAVLPSSRCPQLCTRHMPEFAGRQQKLSRFLVKMVERQADAKDSLPGSQEAGEIRENLNPLGVGAGAGTKRGSDGIPESSAPRGKRSKPSSKAAVAKPQGLLAFFKPKSKPVVPLGQSSSPADPAAPCQRGKALEAQSSSPADPAAPCQRGKALEAQSSSPADPAAPCQRGKALEAQSCGEEQAVGREPSNGVDERSGPGARQACVLNAVTEAKVESPNQSVATPPEEAGDSRKGVCPAFWKTVLHGPPQPPPCKTHGEPCVLRTVKKAGPNVGRQFFVCARPQGHASNPQARCNFFAWVDQAK